MDLLYNDITIKLVDPLTGVVTNAAGSWINVITLVNGIPTFPTKRYYIGNKWQGWQDADDRYLKVATQYDDIDSWFASVDEEIATMIIIPKKGS